MSLVDAIEFLYETRCFLLDIPILLFAWNQIPMQLLLKQVMVFACLLSVK